MYVYIHYHSKVCTLYEYFKTFLKVVSYAHYGCIYLISKNFFLFCFEIPTFPVITQVFSHMALQKSF